MLIAGTSVYLPDHEIGVEFALSGGPGGQNVNKVETAVRLRLHVASCSLPETVKSLIFAKLGDRLTAAGELMVEARTHRTQGMNREEAFRKLEALLRGVLIRRARRIKTSPGAGAVRRRLEAKSRQAVRKQDRRPPETE